jgi:hypothetical protein
VDEFRKYYRPAMNAFEAAERNGRAADLQKELEELLGLCEIGIPSRKTQARHIGRPANCVLSPDCQCAFRRRHFLRTPEMAAHAPSLIILAH